MAATIAKSDMEDKQSEIQRLEEALTQTDQITCLEQQLEATDRQTQEEREIQERNWKEGNRKSQAQFQKTLVDRREPRKSGEGPSLWTKCWVALEKPQSSHHIVICLRTRENNTSLYYEVK